MADGQQKQIANSFEGAIEWLTDLQGENGFYGSHVMTFGEAIVALRDKAKHFPAAVAMPDNKILDVWKKSSDMTNHAFNMEVTVIQFAHALLNKATILTDREIVEHAKKYCLFDEARQDYDVLRYECRDDLFNLLRNLIAAPASLGEAKAVAWTVRLDKEESLEVGQAFEVMLPSGEWDSWHAMSPEEAREESRKRWNSEQKKAARYAAPVAQALPVAVEKLPTILFDGFAVLQALDAKAAKRTSAENVADTLDAVVRIMRRQGEKAS